MLVYDLYDNINEFIQAKVSLSKIFRYYLILIPSWIVLIMPVTLLLSLLYVLSDMSKHGELTALRASGLDFFRLMAGYLTIGICVSIQMLCLNLAWSPKASYDAKAFLEKTTRKSRDPKSKAYGVAYHDIVGNRFWTIAILDPQSERATDIEITQTEEVSQEPRLQISARSGTYENGHWVLHNGIIYDYTKPITDPPKKFTTWSNPQLTESPKQIVTVLPKTKRIATKELLNTLRYKSRLSPKQYAMYSTELHSRIAFPIANLVVFLIGIPFGVIGQRRSSFLAIVYAILFFFAYMVSTHIFLFTSQIGVLPAWLAAWIPNLIFAVTGIVMIRNIR